MPNLKIALAQINPTVGAITANTAKIIDFINRAKEQKADLVVFPELAITGYPPEDLLLKPQFTTDNLAALKEIVKQATGIAVYIGFVDQNKKGIFNAAAFIEDKKIKAVYHKMNLPNYAVFDEKRYFQEGKNPVIVKYKGIKIGLGICEDLWVEKGPYLEEAKKGADLILNINASPYSIGKIKARHKIVKKIAQKTKAHIVYVNTVGGQEELIFDGGSMIADPKGKVIASAKQYEEDLLVFNLEGSRKLTPFLDELPEIYNALLLGIRDYVGKNGFKEVTIGLSGGIDSALTLVLAVDALGKEKVHPVFMPSSFTLKQSEEDSLLLAKNLGVKLEDLPISSLHDAYLKGLAPIFEGKPADITEENLQARIRGNLLMALSNKFGWLVLTTGNKSEMSVGYCTLYGDTAGGFAVLKDVPKTLVYRLVAWRNSQGKAIPESIIKRPPTAELRPNQTDQDSLPPYEVLDPIMQAYVEGNKSLKQIVKMGYGKEVVCKVTSLIDRAEYKRRQAPPGPRISPRAFGKDWRIPITNKYQNK
ncbi:MAG: NAD+ synthase [Candidatus Saganbacteria bacterium]|nr:NAD+ synthase [Candidatus Saganbacteria bacterium]